jgi:hypothetical protein
MPPDIRHRLETARTLLTYARQARFEQEWLECYHYTARAHVLIAGARYALANWRLSTCLTKTG